MKYESLSYLSLSARNWQHSHKMRRGSSLLDIEKVYSLISCQYHLQSINAHIRLKAMNQVWYIIICLHVLSAKYPTACLRLSFSTFRRLPEYKGNLTSRPDWRRKGSKLISMLFCDVSVCYQKPRTSGKDVKDRGMTEKGGFVWVIPLAGHLQHQRNIYVLNENNLQGCSSDSALCDLANPITVTLQQMTPNAAKRVY